MIKSIQDINITNMRILLRVDFNVPLKDGIIQDDTRIRKTIPTIKYLLDKNALLIIVSHLGRPKFKDPNLSLKPVAKKLDELLGQNIEFISDIDDKIKQKVDSIFDNDINVILLENTRFNPGETKNDLEFAKQLADLADIFVSDAFGTVHRAHSSTVGVTTYIPGYAGLLVEKEYKEISSALNNPIKPSTAIIGGAKISTKLEVINNFITKVDTIIIGGGMVYTFFKSLGFNIGKSIVEIDMVDQAGKILQSGKDNGVQIILPEDVLIANSLDEPILEHNKPKIVDIASIPDGTMGLDIGPKSIIKFKKIIENSNTIIWNGPMGVFENILYREGTTEIANTIINRNIKTIIGGGDTVYAIQLAKINVFGNNIHISTGGGASLELLSGKELPGLKCLTGKVIEESA